MNRRTIAFFALLPFGFPFSSGVFAQQWGMEQAGKQPRSGKIAAERKKIAEEMEYSLQKELLDCWYPRSLDSLYGGFLSAWTFDFKPAENQDKMIVTQARHTWVNAKASERYPDKAYFKSGAKRGFLFLRDFLWDKEYGGFYTLTDREGHEKIAGFARKEAYGNAFGIYSLAAYYHSSGDTAALELAKKAFLWLEAHSHDPVYQGYFQHMQRDGTPLQRTGDLPSTAETGYKDQNSSIHLLEAFTELYEVWKDDLLRERLQELLLLIRDKMRTDKGSLTLFFQRDWTPLSFRDSSRETILLHRGLDHVSFGHDVETAFLMLEATKALGHANDSLTLHIGKKMVDNALENGWDNTAGGFYDEAYYFKGEDKITVTLESKNWWAQAEGLNTLLMMADYFPDDPHHYFDKFRQLWQYTTTYLIDHVHGDWYEEGLDKAPDRKTALKGQIWKATYHNYRSLTHCIDRLRKPISPFGNPD